MSQFYWIGDAEVAIRNLVHRVAGTVYRTGGEINDGDDGCCKTMAGRQGPSRQKEDKPTADMVRPVRVKAKERTIS